MEDRPISRFPARAVNRDAGAMAEQRTAPIRYTIGKSLGRIVRIMSSRCILCPDAVSGLKQTAIFSLKRKGEFECGYPRWHSDSPWP